MANNDVVDQIDYESRRKHPRRHVDLRATVEYLDPEGGWYPIESWISEVSLHGMKLRIPKDVGLSTHDRLRVFIHKHGIDICGKVKHVTASPDSMVVVEVGIKLTEISREHWESWQSLAK